MSITHLIAISGLYQESCKRKKGELLNYSQVITQRSRKQLIRRLNQIQVSGGNLPVKSSGRPLAYSKKELLLTLSIYGNRWKKFHLRG